MADQHVPARSRELWTVFLEAGQNGKIASHRWLTNGLLAILHFLHRSRYLPVEAKEVRQRDLGVAGSLHSDETVNIGKSEIATATCEVANQLAEGWGVLDVERRPGRVAREVPLSP